LDVLSVSFLFSFCGFPLFLGGMDLVIRVLPPVEDNFFYAFFADFFSQGFPYPGSSLAAVEDYFFFSRQHTLPNGISSSDPFCLLILNPPFFSSLFSRHCMSPL